MYVLKIIRFRDYGIKIGVLKTGKGNAITDVGGVTVGHETIIKGDNVRTGGIASNGSGDYVIALSTAKENLIPSSSESVFNEI